MMNATCTNATAVCQEMCTVCVCVLLAFLVFFFLLFHFDLLDFSIVFNDVTEVCAFFLYSCIWLAPTHHVATNLIQSVAIIGLWSALKYAALCSESGFLPLPRWQQANDIVSWAYLTEPLATALCYRAVFFLYFFLLLLHGALPFGFFHVNCTKSGTVLCHTARTICILLHIRGSESIAILFYENNNRQSHAHILPRNWGSE